MRWGILDKEGTTLTQFFPEFISASRKSQGLLRQAQQPLLFWSKQHFVLGQIHQPLPEREAVEGGLMNYDMPPLTESSLLNVQLAQN